MNYILCRFFLAKSPFNSTYILDIYRDDSFKVSDDLILFDYFKETIFKQRYNNFIAYTIYL